MSDPRSTPHTRFLLDTHVLLWAVREPQRLSPRAHDLLEDASVRISVSAVNAVELALKFRLGKLDDAADLVHGFDRARAGLRADEVAVTARHGLLAGTLAWAHPDPFDRLLAAQCIAEGLTLITSDRALRSFSSVRTFW